MKILHLTLKKKWFDMILSGEKKEEYREIKDYWVRRLIWSHNEYEMESTIDCLENGGELNKFQEFAFFTHIEFRNGYSRNSPTILAECKGIDVGFGNPLWGGMIDKKQFVIHLGEIINTDLKPDWL